MSRGMKLTAKPLSRDEVKKGWS